MVSYVSGRIASKIKSRVPDHPTSENVLKYSISFLINTILSIGLALVISIFTGKVYETVVVLCAFALLRRMSGGIHLKSSFSCISVTSIGANLLSFVSLSSSGTFVVNCISLVLIGVFAPAYYHKRKKQTPTSNRVLKVGSVILVALNFFIGDSIIAATFLTQSLTLLIIKIRR
ncbi:accessory gene regulator B family protein [Paenibacillus sp. OV219]|uniref:accessory gene regulator B family protein n=1 Tax=Paenibacillus sp. OV219 TaxID=1884377 RepID=UPI0008AC7C02|nr:accessory gene regulator B [Paenibacillus sp. OV219]